MNFDELVATLRHNEKIVRKLFDIEGRILGTTRFRDLFENLLAQIEQQFNIPHAWLTLVHDEAITSLIADLQQSTQTRNHLVIVDASSFSAITRGSLEPLLANTGLDRYAPLVPPAFRGSLGSIAVAPIRFEGRIIGSFNQGDTDRARFMDIIAGSVVTCRLLSDDVAQRLLNA